MERYVFRAHVTAQKPQGDVLIENAKVSIQGNSVKLHPGTKIIHSNVNINVKMSKFAA